MKILSLFKQAGAALPAALIAAALLFCGIGQANAKQADADKADKTCPYNEYSINIAAKPLCPFSRAQKADIHEIALLVAKNEQKCRPPAVIGKSRETAQTYRFSCMLEESADAEIKAADLQNSKQMVTFICDSTIAALIIYNRIYGPGGKQQGRWAMRPLKAFGEWAADKTPLYIARKYNIDAQDQIGLWEMVQNFYEAGTDSTGEKLNPWTFCGQVEITLSEDKPYYNDFANTAIGTYLAVMRGAYPELP